MSRPEKTKEQFIAHLASKVEIVGDCRVWTGQRDRKGYGRLWYRGKKRAAHRVAYELKYGPISDELSVCHTCDNPPCINLDHLFLGTHSDNMRDCADKGRNVLIKTPELWPTGDKHWTRQDTHKSKKELEKISKRRKEEWASGRRVAIRDVKGRIMGTRMVEK